MHAETRSSSQPMAGTGAWQQRTMPSCRTSKLGRLSIQSIAAHESINVTCARQPGSHLTSECVQMATTRRVHTLALVPTHRSLYPRGMRRLRASLEDVPKRHRNCRQDGSTTNEISGTVAEVPLDQSLIRSVTLTRLTTRKGTLGTALGWDHSWFKVAPQQRNRQHPPLHHSSTCEAYTEYNTILNVICTIQYRHL